ncbi:hypothetical protein FDP41_012639 [Naegleria fowleri]|uniref:Alpha/beta hydrolase fold-3 domain-containing protein n=1 Tax=Naegleria fowleri TaxID=5763 RepID=A0A6A5C1I9_NAEFO|nr:uncharacterized protein FDP41_012639 [Naegleria fowleri]KAF0980851.1 hypothetical protein FDP41_012639 [Naegleria fowleri]CAG4718671.1 unnamed protein product [Naegleria fowleri]
MFKQQLLILSVLIPVIGIALQIYWNRHLTLPVMIFRCLLNTVIARNKYLGRLSEMTEKTRSNKKESIFMMGSVMRPHWKDLDLEAKTLNSLVAFAGQSQLKLDKYGLRKSMEHQALYPPIEAGRNCESIQVIESLRNSIFVRMKEFNLDKSKEPKVLFYVHGGGGYGGLAAGLQARGVVEFLNDSRYTHSIKFMLSVNYRLLGLDENEKKKRDVYAANFEDQLEDCWNAYQWLLKENNFKPQNIVMMGDSFGPMLIMNLLAKIGANATEQLPRAAALASGYFDLSGKTLGENFDEENSILVSKNNMELIQGLYATEKSSYSPIGYDSTVVSSFNATKLLLVYSNHEECTADNVKMVQTLQNGKHPHVQVIAENGHIHGYPLFFYYSPQIRKTMEKMIEFLDQSQLFN